MGTPSLTRLSRLGLGFAAAWALAVAPASWADAPLPALASSTSDGTSSGGRSAAQALGAPDVGPRLPASDLVRHGRDLWLAGDAADASPVLEAALAGDLDDDEKARARLLLGHAALDRGDAAGAVTVLRPWHETLQRTRRAKRWPLADHVAWILAQALEASGELRAAREVYLVVASEPRSPFRADASLAAARLLEETGKPRAAARAYSRFLDRFPHHPGAREVVVRDAALALKGGKTVTATRTLSRVIHEAPQSTAAQQAVALLDGASAPVPAVASAAFTPGSSAHLGALGRTPSQRLDALTALVDERRFGEAIPALEAEREALSGQRAARLAVMEQLARAYREALQYEQALSVYDALKAAGVTPDVGARTMARVYAHAGDMTRAERHLKRELDPRRKGTLRYWEALADLNREFGRPAQALAASREALSKRPRLARLKRQLAWDLFRAGEFEAATVHFDGLRPRRQRDKEGARYWAARSLAAAGKTAEALSRYDRLGSRSPHGYYGILAKSRSMELRGEISLPSGPEAPTAAVPRTTLAWTEAASSVPYAESPQPADEPTRAAALAELADRFGRVAPELDRATELHALGLLDEAREELRVVDADLRTLRRKGASGLVGRRRAPLLDNRRDPRAPGGEDLQQRGSGRRTSKEARAFARVARALKGELRQVQTLLADPYGSRRALTERGWSRRPDPSRRDAYRAMYPLPWPELVQTTAELEGLEPYVVYSIMTVESTFHPGAVSVANAYGLLQMIPRTGRRVADELGLRDFTPEQLLEPEVSVRMGGHYLGSLMRKFQQQEPLAAAAYNCGPHRVHSWLMADPNKDLDVFVDEIPYSQARNYAKSFVENVTRYRLVYHGEPSVYVSNTLEAEALPHPLY